MKTTFFVLAVLGVCACGARTVVGQMQGGHLDGSPAQGEFTNSGCGGYLTAEDPMFDGLACIEWRIAEDKTTIAFHHYPAGCGVNDTGDARLLDDGTVVLTYSIGEFVDEDTCGAPACGGCPYDVTFVVHDKVPLGQTLNIDIVRAICWEQDTTSVALATDGRPEGMLCKYAPWARKGGEGDELHHVCTFDVDENGARVGEKYCINGMVCKNPTGEPSNDFDICLAPCETDADCPYPDLLSCQDGLCILKEQW